MITRVIILTFRYLLCQTKVISNPQDRHTQTPIKQFTSQGNPVLVVITQSKFLFWLYSVTFFESGDRHPQVMLVPLAILAPGNDRIKAALASWRPIMLVAVGPIFPRIVVVCCCLNNAPVVVICVKKP